MQHRAPPCQLATGEDPEDYLTTARDELLQLASALHEHADFFVVNLSSPNTPGLRKLLQSEDLTRQLFRPLREAIRQCDSQLQSAPPDAFVGQTRSRGRGSNSMVV